MCASPPQRSKLDFLLVPRVNVLISKRVNWKWLGWIWEEAFYTRSTASSGGLAVSSLCSGDSSLSALGDALSLWSSTNGRSKVCFGEPFVVCIKPGMR